MGEQLGYSVIVKPTPEDFGILQREAWQPVRRSFRYRVIWLLQLSVYMAVLAALVEIFVTKLGMPPWMAILVCVYIAILVSSTVSVAARPYLNACYVEPKGAFLTGFEARADGDGLHLKGEWGETRYLWHAVLRVKQNPTHIFVFVDRAMVLLIPKRGFASGDDAERFVQFLIQRSTNSAHSP